MQERPNTSGRVCSHDLQARPGWRDLRLIRSPDRSRFAPACARPMSADYSAGPGAGASTACLDARSRRSGSSVGEAGAWLLMFDTVRETDSSPSRRAGPVMSRPAKRPPTWESVHNDGVIFASHCTIFNGLTDSVVPRSRRTMPFGPGIGGIPIGRGCRSSPRPPAAAIWSGSPVPSSRRAPRRRPPEGLRHRSCGRRAWGRRRDLRRRPDAR
jgi:hypothetical protein